VEININIIIGPIAVGLIPGIVARLKRRSLLAWWIASALAMLAGAQAGAVYIPRELPSVGAGDGGAYGALAVLAVFLAALIFLPRRAPKGKS